MSTIFTKIIRGEIPCHKIAENDRYFAFLDIRPIRPGHTLVVPKVETDYIFDLDDDVLGGIMNFSRPIAKALEKSVPCARVGIIVAGLEVPHAHVHLVPFNAIGDLSFANARPETQEHLAEVANRIRGNLE
ncbi:MAG TPA: HIT family protein [Kiritimatiellia bacterium]|nr:HIT family protein [Kiritimatiellia bacterium]